MGLSLVGILGSVPEHLFLDGKVIVPESGPGSVVALVEGCSPQYTDELLQLQRCTPCRAVSLPQELEVITTPLNLAAWSSALCDHPDRRLVEVLVDGIAGGFRIGSNYQHHLLKSARSNMKSAFEHPEIVSNYLGEEVSKGRVVDPFPKGSIPNLQISPFSVIPKSQPGKWRLILDLSSPDESSVNDGITKSLCSLKYLTVDKVVMSTLKYGRGALLGNIDIQSAFRIIPVHPHDRLLLGMQWEGMVYVDTTLPFGLRSAPKLFNAVADALEWVMRKRGAQLVGHYLDDFIFVGPPESDVCRSSMDTALDTCQKPNTRWMAP